MKNKVQTLSIDVTNNGFIVHPCRSSDKMSVEGASSFESFDSLAGYLKETLTEQRPDSRNYLNPCVSRPMLTTQLEYDIVRDELGELRRKLEQREKLMREQMSINASLSSSYMSLERRHKDKGEAYDTLLGRYDDLAEKYKEATSKKKPAPRKR